MACGCNSTPCSCSGVSMSVPDVSVQPIYGCSCDGNPCSCGAAAAPCDLPTLCDLDRKCNVWVDGVVDANGQGGICLLDTMEECQVINSLQRSQRAKDDLLKVTSNAYLRNLANTTPLHPTANEGDTIQKEINQGTIPFYTLFRGQPPFAQ